MAKVKKMAFGGMGGMGGSPVRTILPAAGFAGPRGGMGGPRGDTPVRPPISPTAFMTPERTSVIGAPAPQTATPKTQTAAIQNTAAARPMKKGGTTASKRADGVAQRGKTRGKMV